jgi:hypothetical protein
MNKLLSTALALRVTAVGSTLNLNELITGIMRVREVEAFEFEANLKSGFRVDVTRGGRLVFK